MDNNKRQKIAILFPYCILLVVIIVILVNIILFWSRFCFQTGINQMNRQDYDSALASFQRAQNIIPDTLTYSVARQDLFRIYTQLGTIFYAQAPELLKEKGFTSDIINLYEQSKKNFEKARKIDSGTYIPAYRLARTCAALEVIYAKLFPDKPNPYNAGPLYQEAINLRPNGIDVHASYARYLYYKKDFIGLKAIVRNMARIYPAIYSRLKREPFFSPDLMPEIEKGLLDAVEQNIGLVNAHSVLSAYYNEIKDYDKAIEHYKEYIEIQRYGGSSGNYLHMGRLYLRAGAPEESQYWFIKSIDKSVDFASIIANIHSIYKKESFQDLFIKFGVELEKKVRFSPDLNIEIARAWMDKKQYSFAKARLYKLNNKQPHARAWYLLALIARDEKDWSQMEINSQKATMLDRNNSTYFHTLAVALQYQQKYESAEAMEDKAIEYSQSPNPWFFNQRAWLRWAQKKYIPSASDWKQAFALLPEHSDFPYRIALALEQAGKFQESLDYIKKATALKPDNQEYGKVLARLELGTLKSENR
jgi:tetratricopeptide (TPR) repeat protein